MLSSRYEGYPTVLFEAFVLQKPIVATDVSGVVEILENGQLGKIVENNENGIYTGMKALLTDANLAKITKKNIQQTELPFTLEKAVAGIEKIINENESA